MERAISHFERAVALDPEFARGWADLAGAYNAAAGTDYSSPWKAKQKLAAQRAIAADPNLVAGHVRLAQYYFDVGDGLAAQEQFRIASGLDPDDEHLAHLAVGGRPAWSLRVSDEELEESRSATARDPLSSTSRFLHGINLFAVGRLDDALAEFRLALELNPGMAWDQRLEIARVLVAKGDHDAAYREALNLPEGLPRAYALALMVDSPAHRAEAEAAFATLAAARADDHMHYVRMAELYVLRDQRDTAFAWLERGRAQIPDDANRNSRIWWLQADMHVSPFLVPLHADARWSTLMAVPDWAKTPEPPAASTSAAGPNSGSNQ
jgi:tetratricopeptide (TPR) repeat protein